MINTNISDEIIAIIPARGGSKGVPRKNIRLLGNKPLIAYTIQIAKAVPGIGRVVVSTEDTEIAEVAKEWGAEVPFLRPEKLSGDTAIVGQACAYTLNRLEKEEGYRPLGSCILFPPHPFRKLKTMTMLVNKLLDGHPKVNVFTKVRVNAFSFLRNGPDGSLRSLLPNSGNDNEYYLSPTGYFIGNRIVAARQSLGEYIHSLTDPIETMDIDYIHDFYLAEEIIKTGMFQTA